MQIHNETVWSALFNVRWNQAAANRIQPANWEVAHVANEYAKLQGLPELPPHLEARLLRQPKTSLDYRLSFTNDRLDLNHGLTPAVAPAMDIILDDPTDWLRMCAAGLQAPAYA